MFAALVPLAIAAAVIIPRAPRRPIRAPRLPVSRPVAVVTVAAVALVAAVSAVALLEGKPENSSPARGADPSRLGSIDTNRYRYWEVALDSFADNPVTGLGSGGFFTEWLMQRDRVDRSGDAHSLYLETAAELGVVGLVVLAMFAGGVIAALVRLYRLNRGAVAGLAGGLAAWGLHAGMDWDWEMPAATLPALLLAAGAIACHEEDAMRPHSASESAAETDGAVRATLDGEPVAAPFAPQPAGADLRSSGN
jgi:O-antigen ligase